MVRRCPKLESRASQLLCCGSVGSGLDPLRRSASRCYYSALVISLSRRCAGSNRRKSALGVSWGKGGRGSRVAPTLPAARPTGRPHGPRRRALGPPIGRLRAALVALGRHVPRELGATAREVDGPRRGAELVDGTHGQRVPQRQADAALLRFGLSDLAAAALTAHLFS